MVSKPPDVRGLQLINQPNEHEFFEASPTFIWKPSNIGGSDINPIDDPNTGAGSGIPDSYFRGYFIQIFSPTDPNDLYSFGLLRRTEVVQDPIYTYTIEKNRQDHDGVARRFFEISVWEMDIFNQYSVNRAGLPVINNPPDYVEGAILVGEIGGLHLDPDYQFTPDADRVDYKDAAGDTQYLTRYALGAPLNTYPRDFRTILLYNPDPSYIVKTRITSFFNITHAVGQALPSYIAVADWFSNPDDDFNLNNGLKWALIVYAL